VCAVRIINPSQYEKVAKLTIFFDYQKIKVGNKVAIKISVHIPPK
jgi:hypothetical protein